MSFVDTLFRTLVLGEQVVKLMKNAIQLIVYVID